MSYQDGYRLVTVHAHAQLYSAAPLGIQAISAETWYPAQSNYPDSEPTCPCYNLTMPNTWLGSDKYQFDMLVLWVNHGFELMISRARVRCSTDSATMPCNNVSWTKHIAMSSHVHIHGSYPFWHINFQDFPGAFDASFSDTFSFKAFIKLMYLRIRQLFIADSLCKITKMRSVNKQKQSTGVYIFNIEIKVAFTHTR